MQEKFTTKYLMWYNELSIFYFLSKERWNIKNFINLTKSLHSIEKHAAWILKLNFGYINLKPSKEKKKCFRA